MGGYGSGRRWGRTTVEDCLNLDANAFARYCKSTGTTSGISRWTRNGCETASCGFVVYISASIQAIVFRYRYQDQDRPDVQVNLSSYRPGFGGRRYFFICPHCMRRQRTLHLKGGGIACRHCHNLSYRSCNESHSYDSLFMSMAASDGHHTWKNIKRLMNYRARTANKKPKRPRGRPRKRQ